MKFLLIVLVVGIVISAAEEIIEANDRDNEIPENASQDPVKLDEATTKKIVSAPTDSYGCFSIPLEYCLEDKNSMQECNPHPDYYTDTLICCNVTDLDKALQNFKNRMWTNIHIHNLTAQKLDLNTPLFKQAQSVAVTNGNIKKIVNAFSRMSYPKCLNFSNNSIFEIENQSAFSQSRGLRMLDLSYNNLTKLPNVVNNITVDLRGNLNISCKLMQDTLNSTIGIQFVEPNQTFCLANKTYNWFSSTESISLRSLKRKLQLDNDCPKIEVDGVVVKCNCTPERMHYNELNSLHFNAKVNCSGMGLTRLPSKLPENTIILDVSNNKISSLLELRDDPTYVSLITLHADNNLISKMLEFEGTPFLENFLFLFLRGNKINKIPIYLLNNAISKTGDKFIYLADNRLICDCNLMQVTKFFLLTNANHFPDYQNIVCDNYPEKISELDVSKLCQSQDHDFVFYIYYIIALEIFLLVALILKVSYDYWVFKTTGFLPCPASTILLSRLETANSKIGLQKTT